METINAIELTDPAVFPDETVLRSVLGESYRAYEALLALFAEKACVPEWRYYRDGKAWLCKVQRKKKTVVWMSAWKGWMQATVYLGESLTDSLPGLGLSSPVLSRIASVKRVGKSVPCIFEIRNTDEFADLSILMDFKTGLK